MTTPRDAGRIPAEWLAGAYANATPEDGVADWFARALNARGIYIDGEGAVWVKRASGAHWLTQEQIDAAVATIDAGV
jgi:hypothetical protein